MDKRQLSARQHKQKECRKSAKDSKRERKARQRQRRQKAVRSKAMRENDWLRSLAARAWTATDRVGASCGASEGLGAMARRRQRDAERGSEKAGRASARPQSSVVWRVFCWSLLEGLPVSDAVFCYLLFYSAVVICAAEGRGSRA